jgi:glycosyltransferase involved in cell wall biosynthesis
MSRKLHLIIFHPNLNTGGAETQIINLINGLAIKNYSVTLALYEVGEISYLKSILNKNIEIVNLQKKKYGYLGLIFNFLKLLNTNSNAILYSFLSSQNVIALLLGSLSKNRKIIWGNRISSFPKGQFGFKGRISIFLEKILSPRVDLIISNSKSGDEIQKKIGFKPKNKTIIMNGIDTLKYSPKDNLRKKFRNELATDKNEIIIGLVCRIVEWKGIETFIQAAKKISEKRENITFVCVGSGNKSLFSFYKSLTLSFPSNKFIWLGEKSNISEILNGLDILTSVSYYGEGFPNIIGEGMSVGVPIVATNVGDNSFVLKDSGIIIRPKNDSELVNAWLKIIDDKKLRNNLIETAMHRVKTKFSLKEMINKSEKTLFL